MKTAISTESTVDLPKELLEKYDIHTTPFSIYLGDTLKQDTFGISKDIFDYVEKNKILPKTSAVSPEQFKNHFESLLKDYDAVIHISISSQMSCAYNNANLIAQEMDNVYIIMIDVYIKYYYNI